MLNHHANTHREPFKPMVQIVPAGAIGAARVEHVTVKSYGYTRHAPDPGEYAVLYVDNDLTMSDTQYEQDSNIDIVRAAHGQVLIAGLGLGMILHPILDKTDVTTVTVVEKHSDVIALIAPHFDNPKLKIVHADIFTWSPPKPTKYDTMYFDIWPDVTTENLPEIAQLHQRFKSHRNRDNPSSIMDSWMRELLKDRKRREPR